MAVYRTIDTQSEVSPALTYSEVLELEKQAKLAYQESSVSGIISKFNTIFSLVANKVIISLGSAFVGEKLSQYQDHANDMYHLFRDASDLFERYGADAVKIRFYYKHIVYYDVDEAPDGEDLGWVPNDSKTPVLYGFSKNGKWITVS